MDTPEQMQAIQAMLQQGLNSGEAGQALPVNIEKSPVDLSALIRVLTLQGTAIKAEMDEVLLKTVQGDFTLSPGSQSSSGQSQPNTPDTPRNLFNDLPAQTPTRVTLQIRPTPNGAEAVLFVDNAKGTPNARAVETQTAIAAQTLAAEIPKPGQINQALVLPATLFSVMEWQTKSASPLAAPVKVQQPDVKITPEAIEKAAEKAVNSGSVAISQAVLKALPPAIQSALAPLVQKMTPVQEAERLVPTHTAQIVAPVRAATAASVMTNDMKNPLPNTPAPTTGAQPQPMPEGDDMPRPVTVKIVNVAVPDSSGKITPPPSDKVVPEKTVLATVKGNTPSGQPILVVDGDDAPLVLAVKTARPWPVGTQLQVAIAKDAVSLTGTEKLPQDPKAMEHLRHVLETTMQQNPAVFHEMATLRVPQPTVQQMPGAILFFLMAIKKGDVGAWLGKDTEEKLKAVGRTNVMERLREEFQGNAITAQDPVNGEWRGMMVPYLDQEKMQAFRFLVHEEPFQKKKGKNDDDWARRFLIEVNLTRLGPVQVEGLVHKKKLDLVVRTDQPLTQDLQKDLSASFAKTMDDIHYSGLLLFRSHKNGWIDIKEQSDKHYSAAL